MEPPRDTIAFPNLIQPNGTQTSRKRLAFKPTPRNLRWFSLNPYARRAINAIKNPIAMLEWEVVPLDDVKLNSELERQVEVASYTATTARERCSSRSPRTFCSAPAALAAFTQHLADVNEARHKARLRKSMRGVPGEQEVA